MSSNVSFSSFPVPTINHRRGDIDTVCSILLEVRLQTSCTCQRVHMARE